MNNNSTMKARLLHISLTASLAKVLTDQTLFIKDGPAVKRSTDGGMSWTAMSDLLDSYFVDWSWEILSKEEAFLLAEYAWPGYGPAQGLWHSTNGGAGWARIYGEHSASAFAISPNYATDQTLFIAPFDYFESPRGSAYGVYRSTDAGQTWTPGQSGMPRGAYAVRRIAVSPDYARDGTVFVADTLALYFSRDRGISWDISQTAPAGFAGDVLVSPHYAEDRIVLAVAHTGLVISRDRGLSWQLPAPVPPDGDADMTGGLNVFVTGPAAIGIVWASHVSYDLGQTWRCLGEQPPTPPEIPEPATWLLLGSGVAALAGWARRQRR